jgi:hypothetical protein
VTGEEKFRWAAVLLYIWGGLFFWQTMLIHFPERAPVDPQSTAPVVFWVTLAYLLILSWRGAYISGRDGRSR